MLRELRELEDLVNEMKRSTGKPFNEVFLSDFIRDTLNVLGGVCFAIGGGVALRAYTPKAQTKLTMNLDIFILPRDMREIEKRLLGNGYKADEKSDLTDINLFKFTKHERELKILYFNNNELNKFLLDSSLPGETVGLKAQILSMEGLVITKIISGRPKDCIDIGSILESNPKIDRAIIWKWVKALHTLEKVPVLVDKFCHILCWLSRT